VMRRVSQRRCLRRETGASPVQGAVGRSVGRNAVSKAAEEGSIPSWPATGCSSKGRTRGWQSRNEGSIPSRSTGSSSNGRIPVPHSGDARSIRVGSTTPALHGLQSALGKGRHWVQFPARAPRLSVLADIRPL
jgi:hypothetical protein